MNDDQQLLRYSRQIMLPEIDIEGQQKLLDASVLIVGLGGLGSPAAMYLATSGVGHLILADDDQVELSNLQRQIIHNDKSIGQTKVESATGTLRALNPDIRISGLSCRLEGETLREQVALADIVVDASDNFTTRFAINRACIESKTPLVSGAAIRMDGQISVFDSRNPDSPCYHCLYKDTGDENLSCSESGVLAPMVGIIGSIQALEVIKLITGLGQPLTGRLLVLDGRTMGWRELRLPKDPQCAHCANRT
ncbi:MAG: molybdopterin-synthase adenylyltransferase MoeB [Pseudomonadales bacterium]|nr:molybdopterin-synthase adenylyltransferase MoeB [Pseudomonadales bacterium]